MMPHNFFFWYTVRATNRKKFLKFKWYNWLYAFVEITGFGYKKKTTVKWRNTRAPVFSRVRHLSRSIRSEMSRQWRRGVYTSRYDNLNTTTDSETIYSFEISILMYEYFTTVAHSGLFIVSAVDRDIQKTRVDDVTNRTLITSFLINSDRTHIRFYLESNTNLILSTNVNIFTNRVKIIYFFNTNQPKKKKKYHKCHVL